MSSFDFHRTLLRLLDPAKSEELAGAPPSSPSAYDLLKEEVPADRTCTQV